MSPFSFSARTVTCLPAALISGSAQKQEPTSLHPPTVVCSCEYRQQSQQPPPLLPYAPLLRTAPAPGGSLTRSTADGVPLQSAVVSAGRWSLQSESPLCAPGKLNSERLFLASAGWDRCQDHKSHRNEFRIDFFKIKASCWPGENGVL